MSKLEFKIHGSRGSMARARQEHMVYGGNTSAYTLRTPGNSLVFLDAGSGIQFGQSELNAVAEKVYLAFSHTHADHVMGLGMTGIPYTCFRPEYNNKKVILMGPQGIVSGMQQFYDGEICWPVRATDDPEYKKPKMPGIDFGNAVELENGGKYEIDSSTVLKTMKGNHPVRGGVVLFRFESGEKALVYATDNEFDFVDGSVPNPEADKLKEAYMEFIRGADLLVADAQYTKEHYKEKKPNNVQGFGHSYVDQIIDLAGRGKVKKAVLTHHHNHTDSVLAEIEKCAQEYAKSHGYEMEVVLAREGMALVV